MMSQQLHKSALWIKSNITTQTANGRHRANMTRYAACHNVVGSHVILSFIPISVTAHFSLRAFYLNLLTWALCIKIIMWNCRCSSPVPCMIQVEVIWARTQETMEYIMTVNDRVKSRKCPGHLWLCCLIGKSHNHHFSMREIVYGPKSLCQLC